MEKIDRATLLSVTRGALSWSWDEKGDIPHRFTSKQLAFYGRERERSIRARASAGICLAFETDAECIRLDYELFPGSSRDVWGFDLYLEGMLFAHKEGKICREREGSWVVNLPQGEKRIRLYLPNLQETKILGLWAENAGFLRCAGRRGCLLCLGDSITQGYTTSFPSRAWNQLLAQRLGMELLNQGVGGEGFEAEMLDENFPIRPQRIVVAYGTNDWRGKSRAQFQRDAADYLRGVCEIWKDIPVTVLSPLWRADCAIQGNSDFPFRDIYGMLEEICGNHKEIRLIHGEALLPPIRELMEDGMVHPNELGFEILAERLAGEGIDSR